MSFPLALWLRQDKTERGRRWAWECSPSPLPPRQAISLPPGARAVGAAQLRNFSPRRRPASSPTSPSLSGPPTTLVGVFQVS